MTNPWDAKWEQHKRDYPVGVCAICPKCGGSSMSNCPCAQQNWITEQQRHANFGPPRPETSRPLPGLEALLIAEKRISESVWEDLLETPVQLEQCFWCQKQVESVISVKLLNKSRNLCKECINKLM